MNRIKQLLCRLAMAGWVSGLAASGVAAADKPAQPDPDWVLTADGAYIVHRSAGVAWPRCVEGMRWNGRACEGQALRLEHGAALALAKARAKADGVTWRLPHVKELQLLVSQNAHRTDRKTRLLPEGPSGWYWTATANIDTSPTNEYAYGNVMRGVTANNVTRLRFLHAWAVDPETGDAHGDVLKRSEQLVRLVRSLE